MRRAVAISALYQKWQKLPQMVSAGQPTLPSIPGNLPCSTAFLRFRSVLADVAALKVGERFSSGGNFVEHVGGEVRPAAPVVGPRFGNSGSVGHRRESVLPGCDRGGDPGSTEADLVNTEFEELPGLGSR